MKCNSFCLIIKKKERSFDSFLLASLGFFSRFAPVVTCWNWQRVLFNKAFVFFFSSFFFEDLQCCRASMSGEASVAADVAATSKEQLDYEGRVRAEKCKDELVDTYHSYLAAHPEINALLHDVVQLVLVHKPERPLEAIRDYVKLRSPVDEVSKTPHETFRAPQ